MRQLAYQVLLLLFISQLAIAGSEDEVTRSLADLTYPFDEKTIYWPTADGFKLTSIAHGFTDKGYFYSGNVMSLPEHGGTHLDAPLHFAKDHWAVDEIPLERFQGSAAVIDLRSKIKDEADALIEADDIKAWENEHVKLGSDHIVFFYTGWDRFWNDKKKYLGSDQKGDVENLHFPGLSRSAAQYLVKCRVKGVGLDTASLDPGNSRDFWAHRILLGANIYGIENVAHLSQLSATGAQVTVAPMKIAHGTGAPVRIFAEY